MIEFFRSFVRIVAAVVDEISDQNAYRRHLAAHGTVHSPDEWRRCQDQLSAANARRPRCC